MTRYAPALLALTLLPLAACDDGDPDDGTGTIRRVVITEILIDDAPLTAPDGGSWDGTLGGGPDIYVELVNDDTGTIVESYENRIFSNVDQNDFPLELDLDSDTALDPLVFTRFNTPLAFDLYDDDPTTEDDFMGSTEAFNLQAFVDGDRPTFLRVESTDGEIVVSIRLRYER